MTRIFAVGLCVVTVALAACGEKQSSTSAPTIPSEATTQPVSELSGQALHDAHCISCHDSTAYTRAERTVKDLAALTTRVRHCNANLATQLSDGDLDKIVAYLNDTFYKFPK